MVGDTIDGKALFPVRTMLIKRGTRNTIVWRKWWLFGRALVLKDLSCFAYRID